MKFIRIFLLVLIIIGLGLLATQKFWVPKLVEFLLAHEEDTSVQMPEQTIATDEIQFRTPPEFGLAVTKEQILVKSYIPPCSESFDYCFYYKGSQFVGTNFESAGIRVKKRAELNTQKICLNTPPAGFDSSTFPAGTTSRNSYSASIFSPVSDAGAGHYSNGELYRIYLNNSCYEIETRIGETQFGNYPAGTIKQFTEQNRDAIYSRFNAFFDGLKIRATGEKIVLPASEN